MQRECGRAKTHTDITASVGRIRRGHRENKLGNDERIVLGRVDFLVVTVACSGGRATGTLNREGLGSQIEVPAPRRTASSGRGLRKRPALVLECVQRTDMSPSASPVFMLIGAAPNEPSLI
jgi:hypothetical protein